MIFQMMIIKRKIRRNKENLKIRKLIRNKIKSNNKKIRRNIQKVKNPNQKKKKKMSKKKKKEVKIQIMKIKRVRDLINQ